MAKKSEIYVEGIINVNDQDWSGKAVLGYSQQGVYGSGSDVGVYAITDGSAGSYGLKAMHGGGKGAIRSQGDVHHMEGKMGIDTDDPKEKLDVNGAIKVGDRDDSGAAPGTMRWNQGSAKLQVFDGSNWINLH